MFTFEILEDLVKKYFNPLKPDSARVVYQILPDQYADPDTTPNPIKMEVEIRDKDSVLVYGPRELDSLEMKNQVLFWDGKDNQGDTVSVANNPHQVQIGLEYHNSNKCFRQTEVLRNNLNLKFDEVIEQKEETIGGFVFWNRDDDNNNKIPDNEESNLGASEDDLVPLTIEFDSNEEDGEIILSTKTTGTGEIKVWTSADKVEPISLPLKYELPSEFPKTLWIEGDLVSNRPQNIQLVLEHHSSLDTYQDQVKVTVFHLYAKFVAFNYDENSTNKDAINIRKDPDNEVQIPEWEIAEDLISDPKRHDPAVYVMSNDSIRVMASFILRPGGIESVDLMAEIANPVNSLGNLEWKNVEFLGIVSKGVKINNKPGFVDFTTEKGTGNSVNREEITWKWKVRNLQEETGQTELPLNVVAPCTVYTILAEPAIPWKPAAPNQVWTKVLDYACTWAKGKQNEEEAVDTITISTYTIIGEDHDYSFEYIPYAEGQTFHLSEFLNASDGDCRCMSAFVHVLCRAIGGSNIMVKQVTGDTLYPWRFWYRQINLFGNPVDSAVGLDGWTLEPNWENPIYVDYCWFGYHQVVEYSGAIYDPTIMVDPNDEHIPVNMNMEDYKNDVHYYGNWAPQPPFSYTEVD